MSHRRGRTPQNLPDGPTGTLPEVVSNERLAAILAAIIEFREDQVVEREVDGRKWMRNDVPEVVMQAVQTIKYDKDGSVRQVIAYRKEWALKELMRIRGMYDREQGANIHTIEVKSAEADDG